MSEKKRSRKWKRTNIERNELMAGRPSGKITVSCLCIISPPPEEEKKVLRKLEIVIFSQMPLIYFL